MKKSEILDMLNSMNENGELNYSAYSAIFDAVSEMEMGVDWIPVKFRDPTPEEKEDYPDYVKWADFKTPADGQEILVTIKSNRGGSYVSKDECYSDGELSLDSGFDWGEDVTAWAPMPAPYEPKEAEL